MRGDMVSELRLAAVYANQVPRAIVRMDDRLSIFYAMRSTHNTFAIDLLHLRRVFQDDHFLLCRLRKIFRAHSIIRVKNVPPTGRSRFPPTKCRSDVESERKLPCQQIMLCKQILICEQILLCQCSEPV